MSFEAIEKSGKPKKNMLGTPNIIPIDPNIVPIDHNIIPWVQNCSLTRSGSIEKGVNYSFIYNPHALHYLKI